MKMTSNKQTDGPVARASLDVDEIAEVRELQRACQEENLRLLYGYPSAEDGADFFLYRRDGRLVGYLELTHYGPEEVEATGMVHPDERRRGVFTALFRLAVEEATRRGFGRMLLTVERRSESGQAFARKFSDGLAFTEHLLSLERERFAPVSGAVVLSELPAGRAAEAEEVEKRCFGEVIDKPLARRFVGRLDGRAVGKIDIDVADDEACLSGFAVLPEERGKGYGRQMLGAAVALLLEEGAERIVIEVETQNQRALDLYLSTGFRVETSFDYFTLPLR